MSSLADEYKISRDRNGMKHIVLKCEAARRNSKSLMNGDSRSKDGRSNGGVDHFECMANILMRIAVEEDRS